MLWESNAIVRYLAARHGSGTMWPEDLWERADAERWMDWQLGTLWANMRPVFLGLIRTSPEVRDEISMEVFRRKTLETWNILEAYLFDRDYVTGRLWLLSPCWTSRS